MLPIDTEARKLVWYGFGQWLKNPGYATAMYLWIFLEGYAVEHVHHESSVRIPAITSTSATILVAHVRVARALLTAVGIYEEP